MSEMGRAVVKKVGDREVVCRELTVSAVRSLLHGAPSTNYVDAALFVDIRLDDLPIFTNLTAQDVDGMYPSELSVVVEGCRSVNTDFFGMLDRVSKAKPLA